MLLHEASVKAKRGKLRPKRDVLGEFRDLFLVCICNEIGNSEDKSIYPGCIV